MVRNVVGTLLARATGHWENAVTNEEYAHRVRTLDSPAYDHLRGRVPSREEWEATHDASEQLLLDLKLELENTRFEQGMALARAHNEAERQVHVRYSARSEYLPHGQQEQRGHRPPV